MAGDRSLTVPIAIPGRKHASAFNTPNSLSYTLKVDIVDHTPDGGEKIRTVTIDDIEAQKEYTIRGGTKDFKVRLEGPPLTPSVLTPDTSPLLEKKLESDDLDAVFIDVPDMPVEERDSGIQTVDSQPVKINIETELKQVVKSEATETQPLLGPKPTTPWRSILYDYTISPIVKGAKYVYHHPVLFSISVATAAPAALNAAAMPSGITPDKISLEWLRGMSAGTLMHSIASCSSSLAVNAINFAYFLPNFWQSFRTSIVHTFDSPGDFADNFLCILLAVGGATAQASIAYNAFLWLPAGAISASVPAAISFSMTLTSRYLGVKNILKQMHNIFNDNARAQTEFADLLDHIDEKYLATLQNKFNQLLLELFSNREPGKPLSEEEFAILEQKLATLMTDLAATHPDLVKDKKWYESLLTYSASLAKFLLAFFCLAGPYFLTYLQKGYDGVNTIVSKIPGVDLNEINEWLSRLIGFAPGLASGALAYDSTMKIFDTIFNLIRHLISKPSDLLFAIPIGIANYFAASGPQNVALGVAKNAKNIIWMGLSPWVDWGYVMLNAAAGFVINTNASVMKAFSSEAPDHLHVTLKDIQRHAADPNIHPVTIQTAAAFRLFATKVSKTVPEEEIMQLKQTEPVLI